MKLKNGTVVSSSLFKLDSDRNVTAFNKFYKNYPIRAGIVVARYEISDKRNVSKLCVEYDVIVTEQREREAVVPVLYSNCVSAEGLGSVADFFEKKIRKQKKVFKKGSERSFNDQDGALVLVMCLDGNSSRGVIVGGLKHPNRKTKLVGKEEILAAEYNGVAIDIKEDGSCTLTFKGATNNDGTPKDSNQGNTTVGIETDGSFQIANKGVTQRNQKDGKFSVAAQDSVTISAKTEMTLSTDDKLAVTAKADASLACVNLAIKASGSSTFEMASLDIASQGEANLKGQMINIEGQSMVKIKANQVVLDGFVNIGSAGGPPALIMQTQFFGIGNLGAPVISTAIGPFSSKVTII